ncbi:glycosyltransferase family 2 protein [Gordonibacter massiliensis (ex Traore et al. 2017)]|uniref:glycosyltransferase family 2 protein n=1 Tax=Gordonibacter massiliensis (ex Traore et al. 2017) TaxID=1841863 RepID=UPI001C8CB3E4|nr:glycosyltransferase [Gordonibacter massiliensis (ex Traore et al. 2017)]MBX9033654.1 glycosyltransferase [Gordonibacter massiliensis (ex Traore et al. 2017)]
MNPSNALVSVIVPIMNAEPYLEQCLDSIEKQTYRNLEIILLNDGSTDNSLSIMQAHAARDSRIAVIDKQNQGYGATCNRGMDEAHGEWISVVEPDDWIEASMYADMLAFAADIEEAGTPLDIVKTPYWRIWMPDTPEQRKLNCSYKKRVNPPRQPFAITDAAHLLTHHPSIWSAIYRASFLKDRGIRFKEIPGAGWADNPFLVETLCQTDRIGYFDTPYYCYREETPEKSAAFAHKNTLLPLERWNDMMDVLERLGVTDKRILRAHNSRGFTYLSGIIEEVDLSHEEVREAAISMFERMDSDLVFSDNEVSPGCKRLFAELRGIPCPPINKLAYAKGLVSQGLYNLGINGFSHTLYNVTTYLKKRSARTGGK